MICTKYLTYWKYLAPRIIGHMIFVAGTQGTCNQAGYHWLNLQLQANGHQHGQDIADMDVLEDEAVAEAKVFRRSQCEVVPDVGDDTCCPDYADMLGDSGSESSSEV